MGSNRGKMDVKKKYFLIVLGYIFRIKESFEYSAAVKSIRLIARLDIKNENLIKGINLEGLRVIGPAREYAQKYYLEGADEIILMDSVASLYGRNHLEGLLEAAVKDIFIPITVGGGIRNLEDATRLLRSGADKVSINTAAVERPELISEVANRYGSQAMVVSIEAKKIGTNKWEAYVENGREKTGIDVLEWAKLAEKMGAGEILLTSVDQEGTQQGFDVNLTKYVSSNVNVPVIASGGLGSHDDFESIVIEGEADAVAIAAALHYNKIQLSTLRSFAKSRNIQVRQNV